MTNSVCWMQLLTPVFSLRVRRRTLCFVVPSHSRMEHTPHEWLRARTSI